MRSARPQTRHPHRIPTPASLATSATAVDCSKLATCQLRLSLEQVNQVAAIYPKSDQQWTRQIRHATIGDAGHLHVCINTNKDPQSDMQANYEQLGYLHVHVHVCIYRAYIYRNTLQARLAAERAIKQATPSHGASHAEPRSEPRRADERATPSSGASR